MPIAVPSCSLILPASSTSRSRNISASWSIVGGLWMNESRANTTKPILSCVRRSMKSAITSLAASKRVSGGKSRSAIEPDMSSASAMSTPSPRTISLDSDVCGLAAATISSASAAHRRMDVYGRRRSRQPRLGVRAAATPENRTAAGRAPPARKSGYSASAKTSGKSSSSAGVANWTLENVIIARPPRRVRPRPRRPTAAAAIRRDAPTNP